MSGLVDSDTEEEEEEERKKGEDFWECDVRELGERL